MPRYKIALANGHTQEVEGRRFSFYLENIQHWFIVHREPRGLPHLVVTEKSTGMRVRDVTSVTLSICRGDEVAAAKQVLKSLADQIGEARIRQVIRKAQAELTARLEGEPS